MSRVGMFNAIVRCLTKAAMLQTMVVVQLSGYSKRQPTSVLPSCLGGRCRGIQLTLEHGVEAPTRGGVGVNTPLTVMGPGCHGIAWPTGGVDMGQLLGSWSAQRSCQWLYSSGAGYHGIAWPTSGVDAWGSTPGRQFHSAQKPLVAISAHRRCGQAVMVQLDQLVEIDMVQLMGLRDPLVSISVQGARLEGSSQESQLKWLSRYSDYRCHEQARYPYLDLCSHRGSIVAPLRTHQTNARMNPLERRHEMQQQAPPTNRHQNLVGKVGYAGIFTMAAVWALIDYAGIILSIMGALEHQALCWHSRLNFLMILA